MTLSQYRKNNTNPSVYRALFSDIKSKLLNVGWKFIFTDGSKTQENTSFAVTREDGYILNIGILPNFTSVFTAEAFGILQAITTATKHRGNTIICSDSISVLQAIANPNNNDDLICEIRNHLIKIPIIKLMWVPGHTGIRGNEEADRAARSTKDAPVYNFNIFTKRDLTNSIRNSLKTKQLNDWSQYHHHYKEINVDRSLPRYPNVPKTKITNFVRLRLGHTTITHEHLLNKQNPPVCATCNVTLNLQHLLKNCTETKKLLNNINTKDSIYEILKIPNSENIQLVNELICNLKYKI